MTSVDALKARLRADLKGAMQARRVGETQALRTLLAAIDNAQAVPVEDRGPAHAARAFGDGTGEVPRLDLSDDDVQALLAREAESRRAAAAEMARLGQADRAAALAAEAEIVLRYRRR